MTALVLIGLSLCCGLGWVVIATLFTENALALVAVFVVVSFCAFLGLCWIHREHSRHLPY